MIKFFSLADNGELFCGIMDLSVNNNKERLEQMEFIGEDFSGWKYYKDKSIQNGMLAKVPVLKYLKKLE